jgi:hypothetical protein
MGLATYTYNRSTSGGEIITHLINASDSAGLHFDGSAGSIDIASPPDLGTKFSFEFIVQADSWGSANQYLSDFGPTAGAGRLSLASFSAESYNLAIYDTGYHSFGVKVLDDLKVHHLVVTIDGTAAILYDNGNQVGTTTIVAPTIDSAADATLGSYVAGGSNWDGTFYRARFWNKTLTQAEVTASYENATVPFADQYGSQTIVIPGDFTGNLDGWNTSNTWTSQTNPSNNMVLAGSGSGSAVQNCRTATTLITGKKYRCTYTASSITGTPRFADYTTDYNTLSNIESGTNSFDFELTNASNAKFYIVSTANTDAVTLDDISVVEIGCVSDYDLAFANPTQSLMVQDRAGAADGTASATGVEQVTPIEQLNSKSARIGTSAATPADGQVFIGDATTTPLAGADDLVLARGSGDAGVTIRTATSSTGQICFADGNTGNEAYRGFIGYAHGTDVLNLGSGGATRLTIDAAGNVLVADGYLQIGPADSTADLRLYRNDTSIADGNAIGDVNFGGADADNAIAARIRALADGGDWTATSSPTRLEFGTTPVGSETIATRLTIDSAGKVGIGVAAPARPLQIHNSGGSGSWISTTDNATGATVNDGTLWGSSGATAYIWNYEAGSVEIATNNVNRLTIDSAGLATFSNGIAFQSATTGTGTGTGYTLDAYEEGTWDAALTAGSGTITVDGDLNKMRYTKIGRLVFVQGEIKVDAVSSPTGGLTMTGLPFTVATGSENSASSSASIKCVVLTGTINTAVGSFYPSATTLTIQEFNGTTAIDMANHIQAGTYLMIRGSYTV